MLAVVILNIYVKDPQLWWPNGYGEQALYGYVLTLCGEGGEERREGAFGFREIRLDEQPLGKRRAAFCLNVNGRRILPRVRTGCPFRR